MPGPGSTPFFPVPALSRTISPFYPDLIQTWVTPSGAPPPVGGTADRLVKWDDATHNFRCYLNADFSRTTAATWQHPDLAIDLRPMRGDWDRSAKDGIGFTDMADNSLFNDFAWLFERQFHSTSTSAQFWSTNKQWNAEHKKDTSAGGAGHRSYTWMPLRIYALGHSNATDAWEAMKTFNLDTLRFRPAVFIDEGATDVLDYAPINGSTINGGPSGDDKGWTLGRTWDQGGEESGPGWTGAFNATYNGWNTTDRGHHEINHMYAAGVAGVHMGIVNQWHDYAYTVSGFPPSTTSGSVHHLDQARSTGFILMNTIRAALAGFQWADAQMVFEWCGGVHGNGPGGQGWRPIEYLDALLDNILGDRWPGGDPGTFQVKGPLSDVAEEPSGNGNLDVICPQADHMQDVGGDSHWIADDGEDWGQALRGKYAWQQGIMFYGLIYTWMFWDYWKVTQGTEPFSEQKRDGIREMLDYFLEYYEKKAYFWQTETSDILGGETFFLGDWAAAIQIDQYDRFGTIVKQDLNTSAPFVPSGPSLGFGYPVGLSQQMVEEQRQCDADLGQDKSEPNFVHVMENGNEIIVRKRLSTSPTANFLTGSLLGLWRGPTDPRFIGTIQNPKYVNEGPGTTDYADEWQAFGDVAQVALEGRGNLGDFAGTSVGTLDSGVSVSSLVSGPPGQVFDASLVRGADFSDFVVSAQKLNDLMDNAQLIGVAGNQLVSGLHFVNNFQPAENLTGSNFVNGNALLHVHFGGTFEAMGSLIGEAVVNNNSGTNMTASDTVVYDFSRSDMSVRLADELLAGTDYRVFGALKDNIAAGASGTCYVRGPVPVRVFSQGVDKPAGSIIRGPEGQGFDPRGARVVLGSFAGGQGASEFGMTLESVPGTASGHTAMCYLWR